MLKILLVIAMVSLTADAQLTISSSDTQNPAWLIHANNYSKYQFVLTAKGGALPLKWTVSPLPPGLVFDQAQGIISGVPVVAGNYAFTVFVTDANGIQAQRIYNLQVCAKRKPDGTSEHSCNGFGG